MANVAATNMIDLPCECDGTAPKSIIQSHSISSGYSSSRSECLRLSDADKELMKYIVKFDGYKSFKITIENDEDDEKFVCTGIFKGVSNSINSPEISTELYLCNTIKSTSNINIEEEKNMFSDYVIENVSLNDIDPIALEVALDQIKNKLVGTSIKEKDGKTYLIQNGKSIELSGDEFKSMIRKFVIGKKLSDFDNSSSNMVLLIKELGILSSATLQSPSVELDSFFE